MLALVTGGAGFIGSNLVDALVERGDDVLVLDDFSSGRRSNLEGALRRGAEVAEGSLIDAGFVASTVGSFQPHSIFHLAAQIDVRRAVEDPAFDASVNVGGTINLLEATRVAGGTAHLAFTSTGGAIYGEGEGRELPFTEDAAARPESAYGASKLGAETYLGLYSRLYGIPTVPLRLGNVYGPRQDPTGEAGVIAIFCGRLNEGKPLTVFGDGEQTRDYIFVGDVVAALLAAREAMARNGRASGPLNVGTGIETTVLELIQGLGRTAGLDPVVEHREERTGEVQRVAIDPGAAADALGWTSEVDLESGLSATYRWLTDAR
jgi:UDP-glucose 4-epimerase